MTSDIVLYGHTDSGHACKVALALSLAGLAHRRVSVDIWADPATRPAEFLARSPFAEVPLLLWDGAALVQSGAILHEIATRSGRLGGDSPSQMQRAREILLWEANRIGMCLPQLIEARRPGAAPFPSGAVEWLRMRYEIDRARFDRLIGEAPFVAGAAPGIADCAVFGYAQWVGRAQVTPSPRMEAWCERMRALPQYRPAEDWFPG